MEVHPPYGSDFKILTRLLRVVTKRFFKSYFLKKEQNSINQYYTEAFSLFDGFIMIGGSMFMEKPKNSIDYSYLFYKAVTMIFEYKKIFYIGCNFGPVITKDYVKEYTGIFKKATFICFRDKNSFNYFPALNNKSCAPDIVFTLDATKEKNSENGKVVGFSLVDVCKSSEFVDREKYISNSVELILLYLNKNISVKLFSFSKKEGDEKLIQEIFNFIPVEKRSLVQNVYYNESGNITELINNIIQLEIFYCGRFHAMILGLLFGKIICPISYSPKMENILLDLSFPGESISMLNFSLLNRDEIVKLVERIDSSEVFNINDEIHEEANSHFKKIDEWLNN